jgi:hypothetical protein
MSGWDAHIHYLDCQDVDLYIQMGNIKLHTYKFKYFVVVGSAGE